MSSKLHGMLNLSRIPKELISQNKNGEKVIWIDVVPNKNGVDQYGNSHAVTLYNKEERKNIYLANLKTQEFGQPTAQPPASYGYQQKNAVPDPSVGYPVNKVVDDLPTDDSGLPF